MPSINLPATPPTFKEYQLIHQTQQRQRYPELVDEQRPATSDPWKRKVKLWLASLAGAFGIATWIEPGHALLNIIVMTLFAVLGLGHQWLEYRRAFQAYQAQPRPLGFRLSEVGLGVQWSQGWQRLPWHTLIRVQQVGDWLLLYPGPDFAYYLDLRQVPEPYTAVDVLALIGWRDMSVPGATFAS